ncbi:Hypothetical predicted protein [Xyrichtys novacula]|uniref:Uncharacterized protein n=1 Tax=Xyrichtys novacula TaxID=13765 RepID=A0AAV1FHV2_XYRNO|nr:Hypothetical predicted protein [Xyrichtys novacula]
MSSSTSRMEQNRTEEATNYDFQGFDSEEELNPLPSGVGQDSEDLDEQDQIGSPDSVNKSSPEETKKSGMRGLISRMKAISVQTFAQESILNVRSRVRRRLAHRQRQEADTSDTSMLLESEDSLSNEIITPEDQHTKSESEEIGPSTALCKSDCERRLLTEKVASLETRLDEKERENENLVAEIDDLKERNWRQEKHYGEKVLHLTTALEQAQDRERTLNQLETPAAEAQSESLWKRSLRGALSVCKFIGVSSACALVAVGILSIGLVAHCDCPCDPFSHLLESLTIHNTGHPS